MKFSLSMVQALLGWLGGAATTLGFGLFLLGAFPGIMRLSPDGTQPGLPLVFGLALLTATPFSLAGGLIGGRIAREGGEAEQRWMALILGALLALPAACFNFWSFGGR
jgi:hypothetical protein